ncbi:MULTISPECIES: helix-turn-helix transcriptional regulator [Marivita]|uniref:DNA-binding protein n=1 Tax=Marivita cryptomonadis TaxID=505252 RepID=A0A9Q2S0P3_9RHOB|nr:MULTISPECIES: DNA-binding protein [Marivita]MCR9167929.1 DNA-binding protein [Paracoccaceae bacterium]MBM2322698.1 DNA-binding protein [Marivita cryptomonadis]MBM2332280.1 DNA-binding protein [Marivita cryptomonadis]MBM2341864.1 DNA-binding protein [Marivita cryptomonadis]MBM2346528.1 DNA-binding protein [Marivita cryptomonadis]
MSKIDRQLFRPHQAPDVIGVSRSTIYRWAKQKKITLKEFCGMTFVDMNEIREKMRVDQMEDQKK